MKTTTWNTVCAATNHLDGYYDGLDPVKRDFPVEMIALEELPGYLEICRPGGDTIYTLPDGRATALSNWIVPFPAGARDREGIAVPADIMHVMHVL